MSSLRSFLKTPVPNPRSLTPIPVPRHVPEGKLVAGGREKDLAHTISNLRACGLSEIVDWPKVDRLVVSGHLTRDASRIALTTGGRLLLDHILGEIALSAPISAVATATPESAAA